MLPLETGAIYKDWNERTLVKVAGLADVASGTFPYTRMALDLRPLARQRIPVGSLVELPWAAFIGDAIQDLPPGRPGLVPAGQAEIVRAGDVIETQPLASKVAVRFRRGDSSNILFATERCNSYCLMCSQPPRDVSDGWRVRQLVDLVSLIDKDLESLAISGGEPTLLGGDLVHVIQNCASTLPDTALHVLSNGRRFSETAFAAPFDGLHPALSWGIPLYGDHFGLHDYVVQSPGAFAETINGLYALHRARQRIEIRVVLVKPTVARLGQLVRYIYHNLPFVEHVALMGTEPIGFAKGHRDALWVDPADMADVLAESAEFLDRRGMKVSIYNLPLCTLPQQAWRFSRQSISAWKQDYLAECQGCVVKDRCAGFFSWTTPSWTTRALRAIKSEDMPCKTH